MTRRKKWRRILRLVVLAALLVGLVRYILTHQDDFRIIQNLSPELLFAILVLRTLLIVVAAIQLFAVVRTLGLKISFAR
jgi:hypothetical protein